MEHNQHQPAIKRVRIVERSGFTLIEISIVLVIVGLIIGGIIIGRDMIRAAEIRAGTSQIAQLNTEVRTFQLKYNSLPGDLLPQHAASFGFLVMQGGPECGNEDGRIMNTVTPDILLCPQGGSNSNNMSTGEILAFWRHLSDAGLIEGQYGSDLLDRGVMPNTSVPILNNYIPKSKFGNNLSFSVFSNGGTNFFGISPLVTYLKAAWYRYNYDGTIGGLSPIESYNLDVKIDDGMPNSGRVLAMGGNVTGLVGGSYYSNLYGITAPSTAATATAKTCTIGVAPATSWPDPTIYKTNTYNLDGNNGGNDLSCSLGLTFQ
jgi:prepilin-type N-terminal cleavage/methylation domain-containing protein